MSEVSNRVRAARAYAGLTQRQLAAALDLDAQAIKRTESGKRDPKQIELAAIAEATGLPREFFTADFGLLRERVERDYLLAALEHAERRPAEGGGVELSSDDQRVARVLRALERFMGEVGSIEGIEQLTAGDREMAEELGGAIEAGPDLEGNAAEAGRPGSATGG